jgi:hypothetical protein
MNLCDSRSAEVIELVAPIPPKQASAILERCPPRLRAQVAREVWASAKAHGKEPTLKSLVEVVGAAERGNFSLAVSRQFVRFLEARIAQRWLGSNRPSSDQTRRAG